MTPEEFTKNLPLFANDTADTKPPFQFKSLSVRLFPLRASLDALQQVCNGYLNFVPLEVGRFRAVVPYAYLALLDYGQISEMEKESSIGWFAQTEVYFGVPVEWYQVVNGKWVFRDWAVITPFIYVDDDFSVPLGRTVFGFPKTLAHVTKAASDWLRDPFAPVTLARVKTLVFPELYKGMPLKSRVFLEVERDAPMSNFRIPVDPMSPIAPWAIASKFAEAMSGFARDAMSISQSMRMFNPNPWGDPIIGAEMLNRVMPAFAPGGKGFTLNSLNLKQFRSSSDPDRISYQALTNGPMQMTAFNGAGPLGEERTALGDVTGGYTIKLHEYASLPIARILGLEVHRRWQGRGVAVVALKPVMPFWANLNVKYLEGTNLAWRTRDGIWYGGNGEPLGDSESDRGGVRVSGGGSGYPSKKRATDKSRWPRFNTTVTSAADDAIAGPFEFKGATIRVLPLLARQERLQTFVDRSINEALRDPVRYPDGSKKRHKLTVWSRADSRYAYVYMTASSLGTVTSRTNNVGDWANYELSFLIPVKWQYEKEPNTNNWVVEGVGLVPACIFVDTTTAAVSRTEVLGIPTLRAEFVKPQSVWLQEGETDLSAKQTLLRVETEVFTALRAGQQAAMYPLVEISERDFAGIGEPTSLVNPEDWANILTGELNGKNTVKRERWMDLKIARALALELLGNRSLTAIDPTDDRMPVSLYTLKQFRDVADPGKACYQSLMRVPLMFDEIFDVREIEETLRVRIHEFPSLKIVETLGIEAKTVHEGGAGIVYGTQAIRPFCIRATLHEQLGERLLWRAGKAVWELEDDVDSFLSSEKGQIEVDLKAERAMEQGDPSKMRSTMNQAAQRRTKKQEQKPTELDHIEKEHRSKGASEVLSAGARVTPGSTAADLKIAAGLRRAVRVREEKLLGESPRFSRFTDDELERVRTLRNSSKKGVLTQEEQEELKTLERRIDLVTDLLTKEDRDKLRELMEKDKELRRREKTRAPHKKSRNPSKEREAVDRQISTLQAVIALLEERQEWQLQQGIEKSDAQRALEVVDPQTVIESILSREWGRADEQARWRQGLQELRKARDTRLGGGSTPFATFHLAANSTKEEIETALDDARADFATIERKLYESVRYDQEKRLGWSMRAEAVDRMIDQMEIFTKYRLEMDSHFDILAAWSIAPTILDPLASTRGGRRTRRGRRAPHNKWVYGPARLAEAMTAATKLVDVMIRIAQTPVIGHPSKDDDPRVLADWSRLCQLLGMVKRKVSGRYLDKEMLDGRTTKVLELLGEQTVEKLWLIDLIREAVELAGRYCEVQRDALLNKLSKAYQKPDFCIRRDSVGPAARDKYFSIRDSWDENWYGGGASGDKKD